MKEITVYYLEISRPTLDSSFDDKLGDYGLARLVDHSKGLKNTLLAGVGYIALEFQSSGKASEESDVYSFGVVALEIACGKRSIEPKFHELDALLLPWVWESYGNGKVLDVADKKMGMEFDPKQMECLAQLPNLPSTIPVPCYNAPIAPGIGTSEPVFVGTTEIGTRELMCIRVIRASNRRYAHIGDVIIAVIKEAVPNTPLERSEVIRAVIVRTRKELKRDNEMII
ncbi:hypothetical protein Gotur_031460 [Gossypium turneri]